MVNNRIEYNFQNTGLLHKLLLAKGVACTLKSTPDPEIENDSITLDDMPGYSVEIGPSEDIYVCFAAGNGTLNFNHNINTITKVLAFVDSWEAVKNMEFGK